MSLRIVYLGNIWEYPSVLAELPGVTLAALLYEEKVAAEDALRLSRQTGAKTFRVGSDEDVRAALEAILAGGVIDLGIIANFGIILSETTLGLARAGFVNFHPGLLPAQAGREPVRKVWESGESVSGLTVHRVIARVDAGPILSSTPYHIDRARSLDDNLRAIFRLGLPLLPRVIFPL